MNVKTVVLLKAPAEDGEKEQNTYFITTAPQVLVRRSMKLKYIYIF